MVVRGCDGCAVRTENVTTHLCRGRPGHLLGEDRGRFGGRGEAEEPPTERAGTEREPEPPVHSVDGWPFSEVASVGQSSAASLRRSRPRLRSSTETPMRIDYRLKVPPISIAVSTRQVVGLADR
jgi:hypothetical protein